MGNKKTVINPAPSLDARNITSLPEFETHGEAVQFVADDFQKIYNSIEKTAQLQADLVNVGTLTKEQKILKIAEIGKKHQTNAVASLLIIRGRLEEKIGDMEKQLSKPFQSGKQEMAAEIRAHFKNMSVDDRRAQMMQAIEKGDVITAGSVLGAPAYLSGISDDEISTYTRHYHVKNQPQLSARLNLLEKVQQKATAASGFIDDVFEKAIGANAQTVSALMAQAEQERAALKAAQ